MISTETFFDKLNNGSFWNAGVTFERTNPVPLEKYSVFNSRLCAENYALSGPIAYPGQVVAVVDEAGTTQYVIDADGKLDQVAFQSSVDSKISVGGYDTDTSAYSFTGSSLSVVKIDAVTYHKMVANEETDDNVVYIVSSDHLNAYDQQIRNVAEPTEDNHAATKRYVDKCKSIYDILSADATLSLYVSQYKSIDISSASLSTMLCASIAMFNAIVNLNKGKES